jgi:hypothetical protein
MCVCVCPSIRPAYKAESLRTVYDASFLQSLRSQCISFSQSYTQQVFHGCQDQHSYCAYSGYFFYNVLVQKSRKVKWAGHVDLPQTDGKDTTFSRKNQWWLPLGGKGNDVAIDLLATRVYWIELAEDGILLWDLLNRVKNCWVLYNTRNFLKQLNNYHLLKKAPVLWSYIRKNWCRVLFFIF